ncbi:MAG: integrase family protein, partial [Rubrivivax sp.]|nr:integrase family protein [Rubrivivax sp.]
MPKLTKRLTDSLARSLPPPAQSYEIHWCKDTPGFGVRVTSSGERAYISERRVDGKTVRRTLGKAAGAAAISADAARKLQVTVSSELQQGVDRAAVKRAERKAEKEDALTLADALKTYVTQKRRGKDGLALKERTKADYLAMVEPARTLPSGKPTAAGELHSLAGRSLRRITADDIRQLHAELEPRGQRRQTYAMQVLRAVLNWHGVAVAESPLAKTTAGRDRIVLPPTKAKRATIPPEKLGAWWRAATARAGRASADGLRLMLVTGMRPGEVFGSQHANGLLARDVDLDGARLTLHDTKNRQQHVVYLPTQAVEILRPHVTGKTPAEGVFAVQPQSAMRDINKEAGVAGVSPHGLRATFATVADELAPGSAVRRMLNHA